MKNIGIYLTWARPGNGKTADLARTVAKLFREYKQTERRFPALPRRVMLCNMKMSTAIDFEELQYDFKTGAPRPPRKPYHLRYWENLRELRYCANPNCGDKSGKRHALHDADVMIDEVNNYCPADGWRDLPRWTRKMFAQHRHRGLRFFCTTQDYFAVDINFRRMVTRAYRVSKIFSSRDISATLPAPRFIYGLILRRQFDPEEVENFGTDPMKLDDTSAFGFPRVFWLSRKLVDMYDTTQDLPEYMPDSLEHYELTCTDPNCDHKSVRHVTI